MQRAYDEFDRFYWPQEIIQYEKEEKRTWDNLAMLRFAEQKGREQGMQISEERGGKDRNIELARLMVSLWKRSKGIQGFLLSGSAGSRIKIAPSKPNNLGYHV